MPRVHRLPERDREVVLHRLAEALTEQEDIAFAYAHGSFVHQDAFRDIDVAVWTTPRASIRADVELADGLSSVAGYPVDVRIVNHAPVAFLFKVFRGRALAVRDERFLSDLIERTARTYHDRAPLVRQAVREAFTG